MRKSVKVLSLVLVFMLAFSTIASAATTEGIYLGGNVGKYYSLQDYFEMSEQAMAEILSLDLSEIAYVDNNGNIAKANELFDAGSLNSAIRAVEDGDLDESYEKADGTGTIEPSVPSEEELKVTNVSAIDDIVVDYDGTYELPATVKATLNNGEEVTLDVAWTADEDYDAEEAGEYTFEYVLSIQEDEDLEFELPEELAEGTITVTVKTLLVTATEAVEKAEGSLLQADIDAAQELVDDLKESTSLEDRLEAVRLDARLKAAEVEADEIVKAVNNARSQIALLAALEPFEDVNPDYIVEYEEELGTVAERNYATIEDIQAILNIVNVEQQLLALPDAADVTVDDEDEIVAAREAYDAIPNGNENITNRAQTKLILAEEALVAALEEAALEKAKAEAIAELENYVNEEDYTVNATDLTNAITHYKNAISNAPHIESVNTRLDIAKDAIDNIKTDLEEAEAAVVLAEVPAAGPGRITEAQALIDILPESAEKDALQARLDAAIAAREAAAQKEQFINSISVNNSNKLRPARTDSGAIRGRSVFVEVSFKEWNIKDMTSLEVTILMDNERLSTMTLKDPKNHDGSLISGSIYENATETGSWTIDKNLDLTGKSIGDVIYNGVEVKVVIDGETYIFTEYN